MQNSRFLKALSNQNRLAGLEKKMLTFTYTVRALLASYLVFDQ
ncbi:conserved hypothetical protein [Bacillus altitudinis]|uniref:Uncharacterized protein n=1 Tax=Bacillus altitudinis TaxID=293387 RepID=A0A653UF74_BACAB|nr:hypothetical protein US8_02529 [Bacillus altitudinis]VXB76578.1 conserved hypothetical protein [Bacillus altitudinis]VXB92480.1 conserved hypothetical protein [Bacillus altitudinis]